MCEKYLTLPGVIEIASTLFHHYYVNNNSRQIDCFVKEVAPIF